jgi:endonuclease/exonuclease/phosphatase family metal-dependent hydrolase
MTTNTTRAAMLVALALAACSAPQPQDDPSPDASAGADADAGEAGAPTTLRVATYNVSMFRSSLGELAGDLEGGQDTHAQRVAEVLQRVRPDVVLLNEFDRDPAGDPASSFVSEYLEVSQAGLDPLSYPHRYVPETNTGEASGVDLNADGTVGGEQGEQAYGDDAFGFGRYPGQYGMVILSRYPIDADAARAMRTLRWRDMPDNLIPPGFYPPPALEVARLSSKNHVDVPIDVDGTTLHLLASHPTPPSFDGPEDRNGRRNHDEIRLWVDYIGGGEAAAYITDDAGAAGGLAEGALFVVAGDLNSDPADGDSRREALLDLLGHPRVQDPEPSSAGAAAKAAADGNANSRHTGDASLDTADFSDGRVGNLRVDYVLPSVGVTVGESGVFWPEPGEPGADAAAVSDHHLVWVDLTIP